MKTIKEIRTEIVLIQIAIGLIGILMVILFYQVHLLQEYDNSNVIDIENIKTNINMLIFDIDQISSDLYGNCTITARPKSIVVEKCYGGLINRTEEWTSWWDKGWSK